MLYQLRLPTCEISAYVVEAFENASKIGKQSNTLDPSCFSQCLYIVTEGSCITQTHQKYFHPSQREKASGHTTTDVSGHTTTNMSGHTMTDASGHTTTDASGHTTTNASGHTTTDASGHTTTDASGHTTTDASGHTTTAELLLRNNYCTTQLSLFCYTMSM